MSLLQPGNEYIETVARQVGELFEERGLPAAASIPAMVEDHLRWLVADAEKRAVADALASLKHQTTIFDVL